MILRIARSWAGAVAALALGASAEAQVPQSTGHGVTPFAWVDDASILPPGAIAISVAALRWQGASASQVDAPVVGVSAGLSPRLQVGASVPRITGDEVSGLVSGLGTAFVSAKFTITDERESPIKFAVTPTLEILDDRTLLALPGEGRAQFGLPVSVEIDRHSVRVFASAGRFTPGIWFGGGGVGVQATSQLGGSISFSRAWTGSLLGATIGDRNELSGSVALTLRPSLAVFGSLGHTIATADAYGAGMTVAGGLLLVMSPNPDAKWRDARLALSRADDSVVAGGSRR